MRRALPRLGLAVASGACLFLACPTFDLWPLMWVALVPTLHLASTASTHRRAFLLGWLAGIVGNTGGFHWMANLLVRFGHLPLLAAIPIMMLLCVYQGLAFAFWAWAVRRSRLRTGLPFLLLAPLVMVVLELCMPMIFPFYLAISQAWVLPVIQVAELGGPMIVTFLLLMTSGALYDAHLLFREGGHPRARVLRPLFIAGGVVLCALAFGLLREKQVASLRSAAPKARVGIVQANVGILEKWRPEEAGRLLAIHQRLSASLEGQGADLIVWPESAYPYSLPRSFERDFPEGDPRKVRSGFSRPLVFGALTRQTGPVTSRTERYPYNTAFMMGEGGRITAMFDKVFLMMFGEYIPFFERVPWFQRVFPEASHFNRGKDPASFPVRLSGGDFRIGPLICYEDILPGFTRAVAALGPNLFVNITNDAWFGKTSEPYQHLALAVFRSVEHRIEMVRAVNTGVSAHIDATGRVAQATPSVDPNDVPPPEPVTLLAEVALLEGGTVYAAVGDLFAYLCAGVWAIALIRGRRPQEPVTA